VDRKQKQEEFKLRISGIKLGKHSFSINCDKTFFEIADIPDVLEGLIEVQIEMEVFEKMITLNFHFKGFIQHPCDRCCEPVKIDLDFREKLLVKLVPFVEENEPNEDDNLWIINENEYELDVFNFVYESIYLAIPTRVLHPDDENGNSTCDPNILKKLEELSGKRDANKTMDSRWEALKNIKLK